jgi:hypothetical protein
MPISELDQAIAWIATNIIGNNNSIDPLPISIQDRLAHRMVADPLLGWPDHASALRTLEQEFNWIPSSV